MRDSKQDIYHFWFMECEPQQWFTVDQSFDDEITDRFLTTYDMGCEGLNDHWSEDAHGALALCLLFDQFPRHMFRGTKRIFATDERALAAAKHAIIRGFDQVLPPEQRFFLYLPFEHSENAADQNRNLQNFKAMSPENPVAYHVAQQRYAVFEKFGRFPERNAILGRTSTLEEQDYLKTIQGSHKI
jgi:uncharacterized protein (DUF924 family)